MIDKNYKFKYDISEGNAYGARWEGDILSMTFFKYFIDKNTPNVIEVRFHGVKWIRTTSLKKYPCSDEEWEVLEYDPQKPIEPYLLLERKWFNDDYEEFMSGNGFDVCAIRGLDKDVLFIDDRIIFSCNEVEVVRAISDPNLDKSVDVFIKKFNKKYNRKPKVFDWMNE